VNIQTLQDALIAIVTTVGIAVAVSIAYIAAGAVYERGQKRSAKARGAGAPPVQHATQTDEAGELLLR
jgi:hypothetical protein